MIPSKERREALSKAGLFWHLRIAGKGAGGEPSQVKVSVGLGDSYLHDIRDITDDDLGKLQKGLVDSGTYVAALCGDAWSRAVPRALEIDAASKLKVELEAAVDDQDWKAVRELSARLEILEASRK